MEDATHQQNQQNQLNLPGGFNLLKFILVMIFFALGFYLIYRAFVHFKFLKNVIIEFDPRRLPQADNRSAIQQAIKSSSAAVAHQSAGGQIFLKNINNILNQM